MLALFAQPAAAQIINVQSQIKDVPEGISGNIEGKLEWTTGSRTLLVLGGALRTFYRRGDNLVFGVASAKYGRILDGSPATLIESKTFGHVRYRREVRPWLLGEVFLQNETDRFRRLTTRSLAGAGPRFVVTRHDIVDSFIGLAYMIEYEKLLTDDHIDAGSQQWEHRASAYAVASIKPSKEISLSQTTYFQPKLNDPRDYRVLMETSLIVKLSRGLALKNSFVLNYDAAPPATVPKLSSMVETAFEWQFTP